MFLLIFWVLEIILIFNQARAQSLSSTNTFKKDNYFYSVDQEKRYLGTRSVSYINENFQNPEARSINFFEGRYFRQTKDTDNNFGFDLLGQFATNHSWLSNLTVNEFYLKTQMPYTTNGPILYWGRHKSNWSLLDDNWKIGAFQPIYKVDPLSLSSQGLTGVFIDFKGANWNLEVFATPLFLPDQGPQVETNHGRFIKRDPWVYYPPSENNLNGVITPINYTIDRPTNREIILNKGFGINGQLGQLEEDGFSGRMAWARKPMNQLLLGLNGFMVIHGESASNTSQVNVELRPEIGYHTVQSIDLTYKMKQWLFILGAIEDLPEKKQFESKWTYQNHTSSQLLGAGIQFSTETGLRIALNYLHEQGGESQIFGPEKDLVGDYIPSRYSFKNLVKTELSYQKKINHQYGYEGTGEWRKEINESSELISLKGALLIGTLWKTFIGMDLLKSENKELNKKDFIEANLANDRVYGGFQYVF